MVDKRLKPGVWGDPPSYRDRLNPVPMQPGEEQQQQQQQAVGSGARGAATWAPVSAAASSDRGSGGQRRGLHTACTAAQQAAPAAAAKAGALFGGPAKGSDVPRTNIGIFGCMNAGKSSLMNRITRR